MKTLFLLTFLAAASGDSVSHWLDKPVPDEVKKGVLGSATDYVVAGHEEKGGQLQSDVSDVGINID